MNELRDSGVDPLIIDAGDLFFSTASLNSTNKKSELYRAGAILEGYNRVGCDAINVGHYEMLNGLTFLKSMDEKTEIRVDIFILFSEMFVLSICSINKSCVFVVD